jgi:hypothetical protein
MTPLGPISLGSSQQRDKSRALAEIRDGFRVGEIAGRSSPAVPHEGICPLCQKEPRDCDTVWLFASAVRDITQRCPMKRIQRVYVRGVFQEPSHVLDPQGPCRTVKRRIARRAMIVYIRSGVQ